jgi:hypothetical protein
LYTHSILNVVYQTYQEIEHKYGSIRNLTPEESSAKLIQRGLALQTAHRCADILDEVECHKARLLCGIGWRAFATSTIARASAQKSCRLRSGPLLLWRPNLPNLPVNCRESVGFRPLLRLPTTRIGRLSVDRYSGILFSEDYPPPGHYDCHARNTEELGETLTYDPNHTLWVFVFTQTCLLPPTGAAVVLVGAVFVCC